MLVRVTDANEVLIFDNLVVTSFDVLLNESRLRLCLFKDTRSRNRAKVLGWKIIFKPEVANQLVP